MFERWYAARWQAFLRKPHVQMLFGARQTGKSTVIRALSPKGALLVDLSNPELRTRYLARPGDFVAHCHALPTGTTVFVDEAQVDFIVERGAPSALRGQLRWFRL